MLVQHFCIKPLATLLQLTAPVIKQPVSLSIVESGLVSSLKAQATAWAHMPSPSSQGLALRQDTARTE